MADDTDWVADVRRWYFATQQVGARSAPAAESVDHADVGYEAARPTAQARHRPESPGSVADRG